MFCSPQEARSVLAHGKLITIYGFPAPQIEIISLCSQKRKLLCSPIAEGELWLVVVVPSYIRSFVRSHTVTHTFVVAVSKVIRWNLSNYH